MSLFPSLARHAEHTIRIDNRLKNVRPGTVCTKHLRTLNLNLAFDITLTDSGRG
jgi:hypothetical protein